MSNRFETLKTRLMILTLTQLVVLFFFHVFINKYLYVVQYIFLVIDFAIIFYIFATAITSRKERVISVADVLGQEARYAFEYANMGIITLDDQNTITWMSELFDELNILGTGELVTDIFPSIVKIIKGNQETMTIRFDSHVFEASTMGQKNIVFFKDVTELNELEIINKITKLYWELPILIIMKKQHSTKKNKRLPLLIQTFVRLLCDGRIIMRCLCVVFDQTVIF
ncbi:hypothetical protein [Erysipelothrix piscisicarius]|uniref:hypothetical protein n=1 Tax=Erysipelothrix piscisicarius TaxID=2485784 RepID=UPI001E5B56EE|nr:hypothetical protein [Erysipelothrix piscisicarius]